MRALEIIRDCLAELGAQSGLALDLDADGACAIAFQGGTTCVVEVADGTGLMLLHAEVVLLADENRAQLLEEAMALNLYGLATEGATLALDRPSDAIVLWFARPAAGLDGDGFAALLASFDGRAAARAAYLRSGAGTGPDRGRTQIPADSFYGHAGLRWAARPWSLHPFTGGAVQCRRCS